MSSRLAILTMVGLASAVPVQSQDYTEVPSIESDDPALAAAREQYQLQSEIFQQIMTELETNEFFAGRRIEYSFRGKTHVIDRSAETVWYKKTTTVPKTPSVVALSGLLGSANGKAKMNIRIKVTYRETYPDGRVSEEIWEIDSGSFLEAQLGMDEAMSKQHK